MIIVFLILEAMSNTSYMSTNSSIISKQLPNLLVISYEAINSFVFISMDTKLMQDHFLLGSDTSTRRLTLDPESFKLRSFFF